MATSAAIAVDPEFSDIKVNFTTAGTSRTDWTDDKLLGKDGFSLRELSQTEMIALAKTTMSEVETGLSEKTLANVLLLAWNALLPGKTFKRIFPQKTGCVSLMSADPANADSEVIDATHVTSSINWPTDQVLACQGVGYICLTLLRLVTKTADGYMKNIETIKRKFSSHYEKSFPITPFTLKPATVNNIASLLQNRPVFKNSVAPFLYHARENPQAKGILESTYAIHLRDTGMRCWSLFKEDAQILNADAGLMLTLLKTESTVKGVRCMYNIIKNFEGEEAELVKSKRDRKTYAYARIYDSEQFLDLQTKNCIPLTLTLASLNKKLNPRAGSGDVMSMEAIKNVDPEVKELHGAFAQMIYEHFHKSEASAMGNPLFIKVLERKRAQEAAALAAAPAKP